MSCQSSANLWRIQENPCQSTCAHCCLTPVLDSVDDGNWPVLCTSFPSLGQLMGGRPDGVGCLQSDTHEDWRHLPIPSLLLMFVPPPHFDPLPVRMPIPEDKIPSLGQLMGGRSDGIGCPQSDTHEDWEEIREGTASRCLSGHPVHGR